MGDGVPSDGFASICFVTLFICCFSRTSSAFPVDGQFKEPVSLLFSSIPFTAATLVTRTGTVAEYGSGWDHGESTVNGTTLSITGRSVPLLADIIRPPTCAANVKLWNECYLRWQPDAVVKVRGRREYGRIRIDEKGNLHWIMNHSPWDMSVVKHECCRGEVLFSPHGHSIDWWTNDKRNWEWYGRWLSEQSMRTWYD